MLPRCQSSWCTDETYRGKTSHKTTKSESQKKRIEKIDNHSIQAAWTRRSRTSSSPPMLPYSREWCWPPRTRTGQIQITIWATVILPWPKIYLLFNTASILKYPSRFTRTLYTPIVILHLREPTVTRFPECTWCFGRTRVAVAIAHRSSSAMWSDTLTRCICRDLRVRPIVWYTDFSWCEPQFICFTPGISAHSQQRLQLLTFSL